jgi:hypothetical protein
MIAVAVAAVALGLAERRSRFQSAARYHAQRLERLDVASDGAVRKPATPKAVPLLARYRHHAALYLKYRAAARRPWLPVPPDPAPPE